MVGITRTRIRLAAVTVAGTALLALVACGSDDTPAAAPAPAATPVPTATPAPTPTPIPTIESLSAADRVIAGLPESTPAEAAVAEGSPQEAVIARFKAGAALGDALEGRALILAKQEFCAPDQRLTSDQITPELVETMEAAAASLRSRGGHTSEGFSVRNVSAMINVPTEALVFFTTFEFDEKKHDLAEEWVDLDGEWYQKTCNSAI